MLRVPQGCAAWLPRAQSCSQGQGQRGGSLRSGGCQRLHPVPRGCSGLRLEQVTFCCTMVFSLNCHRFSAF